MTEMACKVYAIEEGMVTIHTISTSMIFNKGWDIDIQNQEPAGVIFLIRT